jgi:hypothetical protein
LSFDAAHLNSIIASFAPALYNHLESEIDSLLDLGKYGAKLPIEDLWSKEGVRTVVSPEYPVSNLKSLSHQFVVECNDEIQCVTILLSQP